MMLGRVGGQGAAQHTGDPFPKEQDTDDEDRAWAIETATLTEPPGLLRLLELEQIPIVGLAAVGAGFALNRNRSKA